MRIDPPNPSEPVTDEKVTEAATTFMPVMRMEIGIHSEGPGAFISGIPNFQNLPPKVLAGMIASAITALTKAADQLGPSVQAEMPKAFEYCKEGGVQIIDPSVKKYGNQT